jgi:RNA polymerase subunit RPABC4/transcription elongation factor Spt4
MSYLVCDQCGGYYELQPGEYPRDFKHTCECGGNLKYTRKLDNQINCPNCRKVIDKNSEICPACGFKLTKSPVTIEKNNSESIVSRIGKSILISIFIISPAICLQAYICFTVPFPTTSIGYFWYFYPTLAMSIVVINYFIQMKKTVF